MQVFGPNELMEDVLQPGLCIGCGACVNLCPYLETYKGRTAMLFPCTRPEGRCHAFCPKTEVDLDALSRAATGRAYSGDPLGECRRMYTARAGPAAGKAGFQDGGTVSALVMFALESGAIDGAVLTGRRGLVPEPGLATRPQEVGAFATSKYTAAPTLAALNEGVARGFSRMGVVGTPCQLTAVAQMRANPMQAKDFADPVALTVGLFCTWALDTRALLDFLEKRAPGADVRKIRVPPPPAGILEIDTGARRIEVPLDEIRPLVPEGCQVCPDMTAEWADLSVGAMEGRDQWNTLLVRSSAGERLVHDAAAADYLVLEKFPEKSAEHLRTAAAGKKKRAFDRARQQGRVNTGEGGRAALRVNPEALEKILSEQGGGQ